jgi:hypothetical protein
MIGPQRTDDSFLADAAAQNWSTILIRSSTACPYNIDDLLVGANPLAQKTLGALVFAELDAMPVARAITADDRPAIGVMLDDACDRISDDQTSVLATRYAALAIEKECEVIIFSHQDNAGFERFGFRVERIAGQTELQRGACVEQLRRFWGIDILI